MKLKLTLLVAFTATLMVGKAQNSVSGTDSVKLLIDTALNFAKSKSIFRDKVNWAELEDSVRTQAKSAKTIKEAIPAMQTMFRMLGDHHAFMNYNGKYYRWKTPVKPIDSSIHKLLLVAVKKEPYLKSKMLEKGYGYLQIPANNPTKPGDQDLIGQQIQDCFQKINPDNLQGIVIDLRLNYGGAMYAMLAGIANVFEAGNLGKFMEADGNGENWGVTHNTSYGGNKTYATVSKMGNSLKNIKVVVLLSRFTASSGEAVAISFKGRKNTFFIGENTAGYTTSNDSFWIAYSTGVFFSSAIESDRNGVLYSTYVQPDQIVIGGDNFDNLLEDKKVVEALKWLKK